MSLSDELLFLFFPPFGSSVGFLGLPNHFLKVFSEKFDLGVFLGGGEGFLLQLDFEGLVLLLVVLVLVEEGLEGLDFVVFLGEGVLDFVDKDLLLADLVDIHLVGLQLDKEGQVLRGLLHVSLIQIQQGVSRRCNEFDLLLNQYQSAFISIINRFMNSYEELLHRLNLIPPQADKLLRQIRNLDQQVEQLKLQLEPMKDNFLEKLENQPDRKTAKMRQQIELDYQRITRIQLDVEAKSREKIAIAQRLYNLIHEPTEKLEKELQARGIDKAEEELRRKRGKKGMVKKGAKRGEWEYDPNEPKYCYCGRPSFGAMVMCDNTFCELEWFHIDCIDERKLPDKWYCRNCKENLGMKVDKKAKKK